MTSQFIRYAKKPNYSGACWGYNFRLASKAFVLFPKNTPTVVATTFCVEALFKAYEITKDEKYKNYGLSAANFVMQDLNQNTASFRFFVFIQCL